jgi:hypothetical protein
MSPIQDTDLARVYQEERQSEAANRRLTAQVKESGRRGTSTRLLRVVAHELRAWTMRVPRPATHAQNPANASE